VPATPALVLTSAPAEDARRGGQPQQPPPRQVSHATSIPTRMLRYYEDQGLLQPDRAENGYRSYGEPAVSLALIRGELDRVQQRIDCLFRNRDAIQTYLSGIPASTN
jgi:MerR family regulatory protein